MRRAVLSFLASLMILAVIILVVGFQVVASIAMLAFLIFILPFIAWNPK